MTPTNRAAIHLDLRGQDAIELIRCWVQLGLDTSGTDPAPMEDLVIEAHDRLHRLFRKSRPAAALPTVMEAGLLGYILLRSNAAQTETLTRALIVRDLGHAGGAEIAKVRKGWTRSSSCPRLGKASQKIDRIAREALRRIEIGLVGSATPDKDALLSLAMAALGKVVDAAATMGGETPR